MQMLGLGDRLRNTFVCTVSAVKRKTNWTVKKRNKERVRGVNIISPENGLKKEVKLKYSKIKLKRRKLQ